MKGLWVVFVSVFVAELGDKTQLATLLFATDPKLGRLSVFVAASTALVCSSLLAVVLGEQVSRVVAPATLKAVAGIGFVVIGAWMLISRG
ncbi:MAG: TMEM165/GDT1 family protein [Candidatus Binatia bacterium]